MTRTLLSLLVGLLLSAPVVAQTTLSAGDIAVTGYVGDNPDAFELLFLVDVAAGTQFKATDNGVFDDGTFRSNEGTLTFTTATAITAGSAFVVENGTAPAAALGTPTGAFPAFASSGDQITLYQGPDDSATFVFALSTTPFVATATSAGNTALPPGLTNGTTALDFDPEVDNLEYDAANGTSGTQAEILALVADEANYTTNNTRFDLTATSFTVGGGGGPESASVSFSPTAATTAEDVPYAGGTFVYTLINSDGDDSNNPAAAGTVSVTSGADQIASFTTSYSFAAETTSGTTQAFSATPTDDGDFTGDRDAVFELTATTSAASGTLTLTITDDETAPFAINEIHADPDAAEGDANGDGVANTTQDEFVELVNVSGSAINISGYVLSDGNGPRHTFTNGTVVPAGGAVVVFSGGTPTGTFGDAIVVTASSGALGLNNSNDTVRLATPSDNTVVTESYGDAGNNQSLARDPDLTGAFVDHTTIASNPVRFSPGVRNVDGTSFGSPAQIVVQPAQNAAGYVLLSAPVLNYTVGDLAGLNLVQGVPAGTADTQQQYPEAEVNVFPIYDPATNLPSDGTYLGPPDVDYVLLPGEGFFWYLFDNDLDPGDAAFGGGTSESFELTDFLFSASGQVYENDVTVTLDNNANGFYMIGNPFAEAFTASNTNLTYTGDGTLQDNLQTYNPVDGYQTVSISGGGTLDTWEGAFAEVDGGTTDPEFDFAVPVNVAARAASAAQTRLALVLEGQLTSGTSVRDLAAVIEFREDGTPEWDRYDASKLIPPSAEFALLAPVGVRDGAAYRQAVLSVGAVPLGTLEVPVAFQTTTAGSFVITPEGMGALPSGAVATLVDRVAGTRQPLIEGQPLSFDADAGDWTERFSLELSSSSTAGETGPEAVSIGLVTPNPTSDAARLSVRLGTAERVTATVFDALGRQVAVAFDGDVTSEQTVSLPSGLAPGLYVIRVQGATFSESRQFVVTR